MKSRTRGALWGALMLFLCAPARAEVQEGGVVTFPAPGVEHLVIRHPQGPLSVHGWDRQEIHISFVKRAPSAGVLQMLRVRVDAVDGRVVIRSGIETRGALRGLPQPDAGIELTISAPRQARLVASTFAGELRASGFRAGLDLDTHTGALKVSDVSGAVRTHTGQGDQWLRSIQGEVSATGVDGDMDMASIEGPTLSAQVVHGQIRARDLRAQTVELQVAVGTLILMGALLPGARYTLRLDQGDLRVLLPEQPGLRFTLDASGGQIESRFPLDPGPGMTSGPGLLRGVFRGGGPVLNLEAPRGRISVLPRP